MKTEHKKLSKRAWDKVKPIKIRTLKDNQVYVNEYIADGSRIGKGAFLLFCRLGNDVVVDGRCFASDYLVVGNNVTFKYNPIIGNHCVFGDNVYFHTRGTIGSENEFGNNGRFNEYLIFGDYNTFGDGTIVGDENSFGRGNQFGNNARVGLFCNFKDVKFGDNAWLNHPHLNGNAKFGDGAELFSPRFDYKLRDIHFGDDAKIYLEEDILSKYTHLLPKSSQHIHPGQRNIVYLVKRTDLFDYRKTKKEENIKSTYSLEDFLSIARKISE